MLILNLYTQGHHFHFKSINYEKCITKRLPLDKVLSFYLILQTNHISKVKRKHQEKFPYV